MTTMSQQDIEQAIDGTFGVEAPRTVDIHPSGAVSIVVRAAERVIVIDGSATQDEWGVSIDPEDEAAFTGHPVTVTSLAEALLTAHASIRS
jgi:hypothetical protein